ncbi:hypothetical protein SAMN05421819_4341 [Bryocella elongata]|uniref:Uncharacterized protein n=1 Tax=Bryocella elongata TaxID=863522 RepID=A0A1H6C8Y9_9BACT|nr:hypothetical protein [Bryocella elongata]SEG69368.1 hypothetical protein SAMN05421819_4341 [Bryocella elongata]
MSGDGRPVAPESVQENEAKLPMTYRQKELWWEFGSAAVVLAVFGVSSWRHPLAHGWASTMVWWLPVLSLLYSSFTLHAKDRGVADERDREIDARGDLTGLRLAGAGVAVMVFNPGTLLQTIDGALGTLFVLMCLTQMLRSARKLRLYAGHDSFLPDRWIARQRARRWRKMADRTGSIEARERWLAMADEWEQKARR